MGYGLFVACYIRRVARCALCTARCVLFGWSSASEFGVTFFHPFTQGELLADGEDVVDENIEGEAGGIIEHNEGEEDGHYPRKHKRLGFLHHLGLKLLRHNHRHAE